MALLKAPSKQPKTTTLQVRLEEEVRHNLDRYAEFIDANASYVVSEALKLLFRKDEEFKHWLGQHANQHKQEQIQRRRSLQRPHNKHESPFNPIRCAREYSVLKTACPALCNALDPNQSAKPSDISWEENCPYRHHSRKHPPQLSEQCRAHRGHSGRGKPRKALF